MFTSVDFNELLDRIDEFYVYKLKLKEKSPHLYEDIYKASHGIAYFVQIIMSDKKDRGQIGCATGGVLMATKDLFPHSKEFLNSFMDKRKLEEYGLCDSTYMDRAYKWIKRDTRGKSLDEFLEIYETKSQEIGYERMMLKIEPKPDDGAGKKEFLPYNPYIPHNYKKRKL